MKGRVFIVHRWDGAPQADWYPWIKTKLEEAGYKVYVPAMPNPSEPKIPDWVSFLSMQAGPIDRDTHFIGHSIGCQTILRYLETLKDGEKCGSVLLIAGWMSLTPQTLEEEDARKTAKPWIETPINWHSVRKHASRFVAVFSDNDPYVPLDNFEIFESMLGARIIIEKNGGHLESRKLPIALAEFLKARP